MEFQKKAEPKKASGMNQIKEENSAKTSEISRTISKGTGKGSKEHSIELKAMREKSQELAITLNYQLRAERINIDEIVGYIVSPQELKSGLCDLTSIRKNLQNEPFYIRSDFDLDAIILELKSRMAAEEDAPNK